MMRMVTEQEAAMLALVARRLLKLRREAEALGETFTDTFAPVTVGSGLRVKLTFQLTDAGQYEPRVEIMEDPRFSEEELLRAASETMGRTAVFREKVKNRLHYVRSET